MAYHPHRFLIENEESLHTALFGLLNCEGFAWLVVNDTMLRHIRVECALLVDGRVSDPPVVLLHVEVWVVSFLRLLSSHIIL